MLERPDYAIQDGAKKLFLKWKERLKIVLHKGLEEAEEVGSELGEGVEITGDERYWWCKDHLN